MKDNNWNEHHMGMTLGSTFAIMHALWVITVSVGLGGWIANTWHRIHFITDMHAIGTATLGTALIGIITAFVSGYILGWVFAWLWNYFRK